MTEKNQTSGWEEILTHPSPLSNPNWVELSHYQMDCGDKHYTVYLHHNEVDWIACFDGEEIGCASTENGAKYKAVNHMRGK